VDGRCRTFSCPGGLSSNTSTKEIPISSALSAEIKDEIEIESGLLERANLLWKVLDQMFGSSNNKRSSPKVLENTSSSSMHINQGITKCSKRRDKVCQFGKTGWSDFPNRRVQFWQNRNVLG
jgi:hypothetical protein